MKASERIARRSAQLERHLSRVAELLPDASDQMEPMTEQSDGVILHLWQAVQTCIDVAVAECVERGLGPPDDYGDAFVRLSDAAVISKVLATRLVQATGFRNIVAHAYEEIDLDLVWEAASRGADDLRELFRCLARDALRDER